MISSRYSGATSSPTSPQHFLSPAKRWTAVAKWIEDMILGSLLLAAFAPAMAVMALAVKLGSRGPVFSSREYAGYDNQVIRVLKFRTLYVDGGDRAPVQGTVRSDPRVTPVGRVLRAFSFDELPQLINVMRGEMSLVGLTPQAIATLGGQVAIEEYGHRHRVKPGITGWAQVNGLRREIDIFDRAHRRVAYELDYIETWSLWLDAKILLMSLRALSTRKDVW
jgi:polysaccharide biosynthesis protein PslA